jgi:hypothetical protein
MARPERFELSDALVKQSPTPIDPKVSWVAWVADPCAQLSATIPLHKAFPLQLLAKCPTNRSSATIVKQIRGSALDRLLRRVSQLRDLIPELFGAEPAHHSRHQPELSRDAPGEIEKRDQLKANFVRRSQRRLGQAPPDLFFRVSRTKVHRVCIQKVEGVSNRSGVMSLQRIQGCVTTRIKECWIPAMKLFAGATPALARVWITMAGAIGLVDSLVQRVQRCRRFTNRFNSACHNEPGAGVLEKQQPSVVGR